MIKKIRELLSVGLGLKRWMLFAFLGFLLVVLGITEISLNRFFHRNYIIFYAYLIVSGLVVVWISLSEGLKNFTKLVRQGMIYVNLESREINSQVLEKRFQITGPVVVAIGGGTGLSTMLRGLKYHTSNLTAVVTVGDDGGGSGRLRMEMGMLPPGDIRNCLVALANTDSVMEEMMQYRFAEGSLKEQSFGNLFLAAMDGISDNFEEAVNNASRVLAITGRVLPVTLADLRLKARMHNGEIIIGESNIGHSVTRTNPIEELSLMPKDAQPSQMVLDAIAQAQVIILGPGSLFTSILPNLILPGMAEAIKKSGAQVVYVCNIMTQPGETDSFTVGDHLEMILKHVQVPIDYVLVNNGRIPAQQIWEAYGKSGSEPVVLDRKRVEDMGVEVVQADVISLKDGKIRHDSAALAQAIMETTQISAFEDTENFWEVLLQSSRQQQLSTLKKDQQRSKS